MPEYKRLKSLDMVVYKDNNIWYRFRRKIGAKAQVYVCVSFARKYFTFGRFRKSVKNIRLTFTKKPSRSEGCLASFILLRPDRGSYHLCNLKGRWLKNILSGDIWNISKSGLQVGESIIVNIFKR